ncbi:MAG: hypothetical protein J7K68_06585 [Candidatus Diapherotrites archaeon]|nr:hypothetical protein [Candidatus Diapherotrites archaeon]
MPILFREKNGIKVPILDLKKRYGRGIHAKELKLHRDIDVLIKKYKESRDPVDKAKLEIISTIQAYNEVGRPLDYIDIVAHIVALKGTHPENIKHYMKALRALTFRSVHLNNERPITPTSFGKVSSILKKGMLWKAHSYITKNRNEKFTTYEIARRIGIEPTIENLGKLDICLNVLEVAGFVKKLPTVTSRFIEGKEGRPDVKAVYEWIHPSMADTYLSIPTANIGFVILSRLKERGSLQLIDLAQDEKVQEVATPRDVRGKTILKVNTLSYVEYAVDRLSDSGLVEIKRSGNGRRRVLVTLTNIAHELLERTEREGRLPERFRQLLLGEKMYGLSPLEQIHLKEIETWARIMYLSKTTKLSRSKIAEIVGVDPRYVTQMLKEKKKAPLSIQFAGEDKREMYISNISDPELREWLRAFLSTEEPIFGPYEQERLDELILWAKVMRTREETGWCSDRIARELDIKPSKAHNWVYEGRKPIIFRMATTEEIKSIYLPRIEDEELKKWIEGYLTGTPRFTELDRKEIERINRWVKIKMMIDEGIPPSEIWRKTRDRYVYCVVEGKTPHVLKDPEKIRKYLPHLEEEVKEWIKKRLLIHN